MDRHNCSRLSDKKKQSKIFLLTPKPEEEKNMLCNDYPIHAVCFSCLGVFTANGQRTRLMNVLMQLRKCSNHPYIFPGE